MADEILESSLNEIHETNVSEEAQQYIDPSKLSIKEVCQIIHDQYVEMLGNVSNSIVHDVELQNAIKRDTKLYLEKVEKNGLLQILYLLTDNYLYCLEAIKDHNNDYFSYQEDKIKKKNGKIEKVKISPEEKKRIKALEKYAEEKKVQELLIIAKQQMRDFAVSTNEDPSVTNYNLFLMDMLAKNK